MKSTKKSQQMKVNSMSSIADPLSGIKAPALAEGPLSKTIKFKGANKALRLLLLIEGWHGYAQHLILVSKKRSSRRSRASNSYPSRTHAEGI
jgi:hypothetical protein